MVPAWLERSFTPTSTGSVVRLLAGSPPVGQMLQGQLPGVTVLVSVAVTVGVRVEVGDWAVSVGVGVDVVVRVWVGVRVWVAVGVLVLVPAGPAVVKTISTPKFES